MRIARDGPDGDTSSGPGRADVETCHGYRGDFEILYVHTRTVDSRDQSALDGNGKEPANALTRSENPSALLRDALGWIEQSCQSGSELDVKNRAA